MAGNLNFKCVLVTGGAGGLGKHMAQYFVSKGKKVLIAGRTESKLQETAKEIKATGYYVVDTGKVASLPQFVKQITTDHPDLDCIVNNAGVQKYLNFANDKAEQFLEQADLEIDINVRGPMHLILHALPHLKAQPAATIINVSSILGFTPSKHACPVYNSTKAWVHFFTMNLRTQLRDYPNIKVIEIAPPLVESDLHREAEDPEDSKKSNNPVSLTRDEFIEDVSKQLEEGKDMVTAGPGHKIVGTWYDNMFQFYRSDK